MFTCEGFWDLIDLLYFYVSEQKEKLIDLITLFFWFFFELKENGSGALQRVFIFNTKNLYKALTRNTCPTTHLPDSTLQTSLLPSFLSSSLIPAHKFLFFNKMI